MHRAGDSHDPCKELGAQPFDRRHDEGSVEIVVVLLARRLRDEQAAVAGAAVKRLVTVV